MAEAVGSGSFKEIHYHLGLRIPDGGQSFTRGLWKNLMRDWKDVENESYEFCHGTRRKALNDEVLSHPFTPHSSLGGKS